MQSKRDTGKKGKQKRSKHGDDDDGDVLRRRRKVLRVAKHEMVFSPKINHENHHHHRGRRKDIQNGRREKHALFTWEREAFLASRHSILGA